jgi:hypothetical protein
VILENERRKAFQKRISNGEHGGGFFSGKVFQLFFPLQRKTLSGYTGARTKEQKPQHQHIIPLSVLIIYTDTLPNINNILARDIMQRFYTR